MNHTERVREQELEEHFRTPAELRVMIDQLLILVQEHNAESKRAYAEGDKGGGDLYATMARDGLDQVDALDAERARKLAVVGMSEPARLAAAAE
jgi:hypothetical protein